MSPSEVATDIYNAYQKGLSEATSAASSMINTYAWTDGGIVYSDMEQYTGSSLDSSAIVENYVGGWVDGLHQQGLLAGAYFSGSNWADFLPKVPPDDIYVAQWNNNPSVYGLDPPNGLWTGTQRIHQYSDTGSITGIGTVDFLAVDGATVTYNSSTLSAGCPGPTAPPVVACNNGTALGFSQSANQWTCGGIVCGGCNTNCSNFLGGAACGCLPQDEPAPCCDECYVTCENNEWVCVGSPITLDVYGKGFHFTDIPHGVHFRVLPTQDPRQMSWPDATYRNGWLALDRNGDGMITDFTELFGNATPQPKSDHPNGYLALAVFDDPVNGGNGNGYIDPGDSVYQHLLVWIDDNHDGISEPEELHSLTEAGIFRIDLNYFSSPYVDENGNQFRYKSRVRDDAGKEHDLCYDVFVNIAYY